MLADVKEAPNVLRAVQIAELFSRPLQFPASGIDGSIGLWLLKLRKTAATLGIISIILMTLAAWSPLGAAALGILEDRFPRQPLPNDISGIILLGGAVDTHISHDREALIVNEAGERIIETRRLAERYPDAAIFLSGGGGHLFDDGTLTESELARQALVGSGVDEGRIEMEERSRNTCENAVETAATLAGWNLDCRHIGQSHAACGRVLQGRVPGGIALSGGFQDEVEQYALVCHGIERIGCHRSGCSRMDWPGNLSFGRVHQRTVPGTR
jgi:uncharacterized SAM-binding protein YcdF (DUF218 family)